MKEQAEINEVRNRNISDLINNSQSCFFWRKKKNLESRIIRKHGLRLHTDSLKERKKEKLDPRN